MCACCGGIDVGLEQGRRSLQDESSAMTYTPGCPAKLATTMERIFKQITPETRHIQRNRPYHDSHSSLFTRYPSIPCHSSRDFRVLSPALTRSRQNLTSQNRQRNRQMTPTVSTTRKPAVPSEYSSICYGAQILAQVTEACGHGMVQTHDTRAGY